MQAIKAIYDGTSFKPMQPIPVNENYEVFIIFVEPINKNAVRPPFEYGSMEGEIWMPDDFNAPMEDFKEYME